MQKKRERKRSIIHCDKIGDAYFDNFNVWKQKSYKQIQVPQFLKFQALKLTTDDCNKISNEEVFLLSTTFEKLCLLAGTIFELITLIV